MNHNTDPAYAPTVTSLPRYQEPETAPFAPVPATVQPIREPKNGFGLTALILGIVGVVAGLVPILYIPALGCGLVGIGLGIPGLRRVSKGLASNKAMTIIGLVLCILAIVAGFYGMYTVDHAITQLQIDLNNISNS